MGVLVLKRKQGEEIWINDGQIKVFIVSARAGVYSIGIQAPGDVQVDRKEIALSKWASAKAAERNGANGPNGNG